MPHLFVNRPRKHNLFSDEPAGHKHFSWESVSSTVYLVGGVLFIIGSIFFFPQYKSLADLGAWIFVVGSLLYLFVTLHDLLESIRYYRSKQKATVWSRLEFLAANVYVWGTVFFLVGSVFFLSQFGWFVAGGWCFVIGSLLFLIGACINVMQIVQAGSIITLQLLNATAIAFLVGSVLFLVASIPYMWQLVDQQDQRELFTYTAWEYVVGSILFLLGGVFNYFRAYRVMRHYRQVSLHTNYNTSTQ